MAKSGQSSKSSKYIRLIISTIHLSVVLDIVTVLIIGFTGISGRTYCFHPQNAYEDTAVEKTRPSHRFATGPSL